MLCVGDEGDESRVASLGILDPMGTGVCVRRAGVGKVETKEHLHPYARPSPAYANVLEA